VRTIKLCSVLFGVAVEW